MGSLSYSEKQWTTACSQLFSYSNSLGREWDGMAMEEKEKAHWDWVLWNTWRGRWSSLRICTQIRPVPKGITGDGGVISGKEIESGERFVLLPLPPPGLPTCTSKEWQAFPPSAKLQDVKPLTKEVWHSTAYQTRARYKGQLQKTYNSSERHLFKKVTACSHILTSWILKVPQLCWTIFTSDNETTIFRKHSVFKKRRRHPRTGNGSTKIHHAASFTFFLQNLLLQANVKHENLAS